MSTETSEILRRIRGAVSHESFEKRSFKRDIEELLVNVTDDDLDSINTIRGRITQSTLHIEKCCEGVQQLSWQLPNPSLKQLEVVNDIIVLGRSISDMCDDLIDSLKSLWSNGVINAEIEHFKEVMDHWEEVLDDAEAAFFTLPADNNFMQTNGELELL